MFRMGNRSEFISLTLTRSRNARREVLTPTV